MEPMKIKEIVEATGGTLLCGSEETRIRSVSINSNEIGADALFVPIIGERVDAHRFLGSALDNGAAASFTSRPETAVHGGTQILVADTVKALQDMAACYRQRFSVPVVGVTGSVGKTTTKEMISAALETSLCVLKTAGNRNSQVGLPLTVLELEQKHQAAVIEMGMSERGEMAKLAAVACPSLGVMTNIGVSHIAQLGSRETIRQEKCNLADTFCSGSVLYVNGDDPLLRELAEGKEIGLDPATEEGLRGVPVVTFGQEKEADYRAEEVRTENDRVSFTCRGPEGSVRVRLAVPGLHNVNNGLAALAVAARLGIPMEQAARGLEEYRPLAMRGQIETVKGMKIIDDTYNASPDSMKSGIRMLTSLSGCTRTIAVLADVLELGADSDRLHREVGEFIGRESGLTHLITVGEGGARIAEGAAEAGSAVQIHSFPDKEQAGAYLQSMIRPGDGILVKGSRGMRMEEIVKLLKEEEH